MNTIKPLKTRIKALAKLVHLRADQLAERRYYAGFHSSSSPVIDVLAAELEGLKRDWRERVFDLLVSGISHRQFMKFIEEMGESQ